MLCACQCALPIILHRADDDFMNVTKLSADRKSECLFLLHYGRAAAATTATIERSVGGHIIEHFAIHRSRNDLFLPILLLLLLCVNRWVDAAGLCWLIVLSCSTFIWRWVSAYAAYSPFDGGGSDRISYRILQNLCSIVRRSQREDRLQVLFLSRSWHRFNARIKRAADAVTTTTLPFCVQWMRERTSCSLYTYIPCAITVLCASDFIIQIVWQSIDKHNCFHLKALARARFLAGFNWKQHDQVVRTAVTMATIWKFAITVCFCVAACSQSI